MWKAIFKQRILSTILRLEIMFNLFLTSFDELKKHHSTFNARTTAACVVWDNHFSCVLFRVCVYVCVRLFCLPVVCERACDKSNSNLAFIVISFRFNVNRCYCLLININTFGMLSLMNGSWCMSKNLQQILLPLNWYSSGLQASCCARPNANRSLSVCKNFTQSCHNKYNRSRSKRE